MAALFKRVRFEVVVCGDVLSGASIPKTSYVIIHQLDFKETGYMGDVFLCSFQPLFLFFSFAWTV